MRQGIIAIFALFMLLVGVPAHADMLTKQEFEMAPCRPATTDGTQVFESVWHNGDCSNGRKITLRVTDFTLGLMCSVPAEKCTRFLDLNVRQLEHLFHLLQFRAPLGEPKVCMQHVHAGHGGWEIESHTGAKVNCNPSGQAARFYDHVLGQACVMFGSNKVLGCVPFESGNK